jgi:alkaline phosphatase
MVLLLCTLQQANAQPAQYSSRQLHAHNDYENPIPFYAAYTAGVGSIEIDIFWHHQQLLVAHTAAQLAGAPTLAQLYLLPLSKAIASQPLTQPLQLLIDLKTTAEPTLDALLHELALYPSITGHPHIQIVISGNRPSPASFHLYPSFIFFDGQATIAYADSTAKRVPLISENFRIYSSWNGKGIIPANEKRRLQQLTDSAHAAGKKVRFWAAPDEINAWFQLMQLGVDYINTDQPVQAAAIMRKLPDLEFRPTTAPQPIYTPTYQSDNTRLAPKNIILLIGDGMGPAHIYAGYTANRGALSLFGMRQTGISKTSSFDSYITDSAPGSTAFSTGQKTNNRAVGVDHTGAALPMITDISKRLGKKNILISCGDITDATPADFYAHQVERSSSKAILQDLEKAPIDVLMGKGSGTVASMQAMLPSYKIWQHLDALPNHEAGKIVLADSMAGKSMLQGRGHWLSKAFEKAIAIGSKHPQGFFMMLEAAQIDYGGHANSLPYIVTEMLDFDAVIGQALKFADENGETLVLVTADHETGGLSLLAGDYSSGYVAGHFASGDHTATPVNVFAYGPYSSLFTGVYENTEVFFKMLQAWGLSR